MSWASLLDFPRIPDIPTFACARSFAVVMAASHNYSEEGPNARVPCTH